MMTMTMTTMKIKMMMMMLAHNPTAWHYTKQPTSLINLFLFMMYNALFRNHEADRFYLSLARLHGSFITVIIDICIPKMRLGHGMQTQ